MLIDPVSRERRFARVKVPSILSRFVVMPDGERFVPLEQVIAAHLDQLFPGMDIESHDVFRVARNADLTVEEEEADDLLAAIAMELRRRQFGRAVRLEVSDTMSEEVVDLIQRELDLGDEETYRLRGPLDPGGLWTLPALDPPHLPDPVFPRAQPPRMARPNARNPQLFAPTP